MASQTEVTLQMVEREGPETPPDSPLIDRSNASVKALIRDPQR